jgi:hypothetical protein
MADRSRLSFTSSSGSSEDEEGNLMVMNVNESTGTWQYADPEVRAAQKRHNERVQRREEAHARSEEAAREADAKVQYVEKVRRQLERDPLRNPKPKSLEAAVAHLHDEEPAIYRGEHEIWRPSLDRTRPPTEPWDKDKVNSYNPVLIDNKIVLVPHHAIVEEHRFVVLVWDLDTKRNTDAGYLGPQQWHPMELTFRYPNPRHLPPPSPDRTASELENEQEEDDSASEKENEQVDLENGD